MYKQLKRKLDDNELYTNLFELQKRKNELEIFIKYHKSRIKNLKNTIKSSSYSNEPKSDQIKTKDISNIMVDIEKIETKLLPKEKEYNEMLDLIDKLEKNYKRNNERDRLIYLEYYLKGYSSIKIGIIHGISDRQVRNIIKKFTQLKI